MMPRALCLVGSFLAGGAGAARTIATQRCLAWWLSKWRFRYESLASQCLKTNVLLTYGE